MSNSKKRYLFIILSGLIGALGGFLYWRYVGCYTGTCPITSNWYATTAWGALLGITVRDVVKDLVKKKELQKEK